MLVFVDSDEYKYEDDDPVYAEENWVPMAKFSSDILE